MVRFMDSILTLSHADDACMLMWLVTDFTYALYKFTVNSIDEEPASFCQDSGKPQFGWFVVYLRAEMYLSNSPNQDLGCQLALL